MMEKKIGKIETSFQKGREKKIGESILI